MPKLLVEGFQRWTEEVWMEWQNEHQKDGDTAKDFYEFMSDRLEGLIKK